MIYNQYEIPDIEILKNKNLGFEEFHKNVLFI